MYGGGQVASASSFTLNSSPVPGITLHQLASMFAMAGILANPHNGPLTTVECAQKAREAADALCSAVN